MNLSKAGQTYRYDCAAAWDFGFAPSLLDKPVFVLAKIQFHPLDHCYHSEGKKLGKMMWLVKDDFSALPASLFIDGLKYDG